MACQTKGHGRNSHAYPGGRGVQTLEHTDTAETRVQVGLRAIGRLIGRSASRSGLNTASVRVNTRGGSTASGRFRDLRVCLLRVGQGVYCLCVFSQRSRRYGALFGHSASQAGLASTHGSPNTAVPALRCPSWAFGEPSWTCYTPLTTHHSSPGVTVSILGIRRAKLDVLHATDHPSQQSRRYGVLPGHSASQAGRATRHRPPITAVPALRCPSWAFGEPSWTCYTPLTTHHNSPGVTVSILGIRRAKLDVLHATDHPSQQSRRYGVHLGHSASQAGRATRH